MTPTVQEAQHRPFVNRRQGSPQEAPLPPAHQEDRPALPLRTGGHGSQPQGRHHQGRAGRHPQAVQEEGKLDPPRFSSRECFADVSCVSQQDDELEDPYLAGFEWDKDESYTKFIVHQKKTGEAPVSGGKKKKGKGGDE